MVCSGYISFKNFLRAIYRLYTLIFSGNSQLETLPTENTGGIKNKAVRVSNTVTIYLIFNRRGRLWAYLPSRSVYYKGIKEQRSKGFAVLQDHVNML